MGTAVAQLPGAVTPACVKRVQRELMAAMRADGSAAARATRRTRSRVESTVRVACGTALGQVGDPRFHGRERWYLPNDVECGFASSAGENLLGFVWIPGDTFLMGSDKRKDPDAQENELPQHEVHVDGFYGALAGDRGAVRGVRAIHQVR